MPRIKNCILIKETPLKVFEITNDIEKWSLLFKEYKSSNVLTHSREGRFSKLTFELGNGKNKWRSWRILDKEDLVAIAQRVEPMYPFEYMHLTWSYEENENGTIMTWIQDFELDKSFPESLEVVCKRMNEHTKVNQNRIKEIIETNALEAYEI
ncbi:SRPBCC family protein [Lentibacillus sp. N15]|uniref:SRPBCC family protein n=1 Tax=Lentibacillus songyuanensis TaxID=3136161 RepID=UPI0031BAB888